MRPQHFFAGILILGLMTIWEAEFFVLDILPCLKAKAAEYQTEYQDVVINELMWMGSKDDNPTNHTNDEWIELKNTTDQEINISNWQIYEAITGSGGYLEIPNGYSIPANGYFLIANYNKDGSAINVDVDLVDTDISLHNNYDDNGALVLKDKDGNVVDSTPTPTNTIWPAGSNGTIKQSMERDTRGETWHTCDIAFMTAAEVSTMQSYWDSNAQNYNCGTPKHDNLSLNDSSVINEPAQTSPPAETPEATDSAPIANTEIASDTAPAADIAETEDGEATEEETPPEEPAPPVLEPENQEEDSGADNPDPVLNPDPISQPENSEEENNGPEPDITLPENPAEEITEPEISEEEPPAEVETQNLASLQSGFPPGRE